MMIRAVPTVGELVKAWRADTGLTQEEFAEAGGISRGYLGDIERDRSSPSARTMLGWIERIERVSGKNFGRPENLRLVRFLLGPSVKGPIVVGGTVLPGDQRQ